MMKWKTAFVGGVLLALLAVPMTMHATAARIAAPGYALRPWATDNISSCPTGGNASPTCYYNVDSETTDGTFVYAGYQNNGAADGSSGSSIVAKYSLMGGTPLAFFGPFAGKTDGLRINPATGALWVLNNEDAHPVLRIVTTSTGSFQRYALPVSQQGGGYDDIAFTAHGTFLSASHPTLNTQGLNTHRTVVSIRFASGQPVLTPVLFGYIMATDQATGAMINVNITEPDSLSVVPSTGDVVLDAQADSTLVFIHNPGAQNQAVSAVRLKPTPTVNCGNPPAPPAAPCPPVVDETSWVTSAAGHFLVADPALPGAIYHLGKTGSFAVGEAYTTVRNDNPTLANTVGRINTHTGMITPIATGFTDPHGLLFIR